ncbi:MAG: dienelactone hydrolase family protein [Chlamydiae bacterium]|nr:dienelactone hydrolase family protein [Chlamydiota bacterium]
MTAFVSKEDLAIPREAAGVVLFAHGSGSSRFSPRNRFVAKELQRAGIGTLLVDLLTKDEERLDEVSGELRFNIPFLASRVSEITDWMNKQSQVKSLRIGYFGASTGSAAALLAASTRDDVSAIVSRGGRPDLVMNILSKVTAPTLLIVGERDEEVIHMNEKAFAKLTCEKKLEIVPRATHLFEEKGALEEVAKLAVAWFKRYFY